MKHFPIRDFKREIKKNQSIQRSTKKGKRKCLIIRKNNLNMEEYKFWTSQTQSFTDALQEAELLAC
jgi:hypothetical protein